LSLPDRADTDGLTGCAGDADFKAIADRKVAAEGMAEIDDTKQRTLGGRREQTEHECQQNAHVSVRFAFILTEAGDRSRRGSV
jgi:hypothetical protein